MELLGGRYFESWVHSGHSPPPGIAFVNRFLEGDPFSWAEDFEELRDGFADAKRLDASLLKLRDALDTMDREGAPVAIVRALEQAVTLNLTAFAVRLATLLLADHPEFVDSPAIGGVEGGWSSDESVSSLALILKEAVGRGSVLFHASNPTSSAGEWLAACCSAMSAAAIRLRDGGMETLDRMAGS